MGQVAETGVGGDLGRRPLRGLQKVLGLLDPDQSIRFERRQAESVRSLRASRDSTAWQQSVAAVATAARDGSNLVPRIIEAVEAKATVGEIADAMRSVFGEYRETAAL